MKLSKYSETIWASGYSLHQQNRDLAGKIIYQSNPGQEEQKEEFSIKNQAGASPRRSCIHGDRDGGRTYLPETGETVVKYIGLEKLS